MKTFYESTEKVTALLCPLSVSSPSYLHDICDKKGIFWVWRWHCSLLFVETLAPWLSCSLALSLLEIHWQLMGSLWHCIVRTINCSDYPQCHTDALLDTSIRSDDLVFQRSLMFYLYSIITTHCITQLTLCIKTPIHVCQYPGSTLFCKGQTLNDYRINRFW